MLTNTVTPTTFIRPYAMDWLIW